MIYNPRTKEESRELIKKLGLNTVPEIFVNKNRLNKIRNFFQENRSELYVIRHSNKTNAHYAYVKSYEEYLNVKGDFSNDIIVAVSVNAYKNKIILGAIQVENDLIRICATTDEKLDHRTMYNGSAEFNFETDLCDKRLNKIPQIDFLLLYIRKHNLYGLTIEFTIYDKPVGCNKETILINELRNY
ncbi:hypothetical protein [Pumilibacter muris]|uniref:hypothetical protein n=1 Tax=Pumilibacter muris TaxID=2941510 RepID=UPI00203CC9DE|nr:hypothetical protein [Pumilibacter muris]